jgi:ribosomal protein S18 acetylase RimI-like enzyme
MDNAGMSFHIRPVRAADLPALYYICLKTGDSGQDATTHYRDPYLLGHYFAAPYGAVEPESCFVLARDADDAAVGYVLGARDTLAFAQKCEREWFPGLRMQYPLPSPEDHSPDAGMIRAIHGGVDTEDLHIVPDCPAHLHIDLLPEAQKQGWGRKLIERFIANLRTHGVTGVHLGVGAKNTNAIAFYERVGFTCMAASEGGRLYAMRLHPQPA